MYCYSLTSLNISNFYIDDSIVIKGMFDYCTHLTFIDISSFHIISPNDYGFFFTFLPKKGKIYVSNDFYNYTKSSLFNWEIFIK